MSNLKSLSTPFAAVLLTCFSFNALAQDDGSGLVIQPRLGVQWKNLDLSQTWISTEGLQEKGGIDTTLPTYSLGLTFALNRWALSISYEDVLEATSAKTDVPLTNTTYPQFFDPAPDPKVGSEVERSDFSVTLSYNVWQTLNLVAGYTEGETLLTPDKVVCDSSSLGEFANCNPEDESNVPYLTGFYVPGSTTYKQEYREDGYFFGATYSWFVGPGSVTLSAAYADMDGKYVDNFGNAAPSPDQVRLANLSGDSTGTSISLRWTAPISDRISYYFDVRQQRYDLDATNGLSGAWREAKVGRVKQEEELTGFMLGINMSIF